jgi:hypothetical protein
VHPPYVQGRPVIASGGPSEASPLGHVVNATMICRRSTFERLNGFADFRCGADSEFVARAHLAGVRFFFDEAVVGLRRVHDLSLSRCSEFAIGTEHVRQVHAQIARLRKQVCAGGPAVDLRAFGPLDRQRQQADTERLESRPPASPGRVPSQLQLACLEPDASVLGFLEREGLVGLDAPRSPAILRLDRFAGLPEFVASLSRSARRDIQLANRLSYVCRDFDPLAHRDEIVAIVRSRPQRQGRPMRDTISSVLDQIGGETRRPSGLTEIGDANRFSR